MLKNTFIILAALMSYSLYAQIPASNQDMNTETLLTQFIEAKGAGIITFDSSNIKQFWVDKSVVSRNDSFEILLDNRSRESVPLKIQLMNVNEAQDCLIEVISISDNFGFSILNDKQKVLSSSSPEEGFIHYVISSASIHLEDTPEMSFNIKFNSKTQNILSIKKIILSFTKNINSSFLLSPGEIKVSSNMIKTSQKVTDIDANSFSATGKQTAIFFTKKLLVSDNAFSSSVTIKNTGDAASNIYIGYGLYNRDRVWLNARNYPRNNNSNVLSIISSSEGSEKIITNAYSDWAKDCYLALNAKGDMSDLPNNSFAGTIVKIAKLDNGQAEITLNKPLKSKLNDGTKVRVHGTHGSYFYTNVKRLQPGEEQTFTSTIKKDDNFLKYSPKAFPKGVYYVVPLILSYSVDSSKDNTILISNYTISY